MMSIGATLFRYMYFNYVCIYVCTIRNAYCLKEIFNDSHLQMQSKKKLTSIGATLFKYIYNNYVCTQERIQKKICQGAQFGFSS